MFFESEDGRPRSFVRFDFRVLRQKKIFGRALTIRARRFEFEFPRGGGINIVALASADGGRFLGGRLLAAPFFWPTNFFVNGEIARQKIYSSAGAEACRRQKRCAPARTRERFPLSGGR
jgi:hypothetical protein